MANQSVLELAVGTGKWDAGLKKARSALDNFTQANGGLQQALDKESQKMQKFVQMMGGMESTAKTAKGQMNDYKSTIEQLTMQYNRMTEAQKKVIGQDYLQAIEQMKQKYQSVNEEIQEMNRSLNKVKLPDMKDGGCGLFSGLGDKMSGALQVFAGNMLTKAEGAVASLGSEMVDMVKQGVEMAKAGEGIRIAFERLGRGDILDGLREATHGTVTDLELMKAAVKFNDFKLPVEELGTMLAFAQQKAKDTGQSVDYMVDSIVTGLGRKSLMILDNLGLSATEVKEKMAETGDMTKAVGAIIREQMAKAGDYVETAADRAAQANVSLQNKMEELGRKFAPLEEASNNFWTSMKIGILDVIGGPLTDLLNKLTQAGRMANAYGLMGGNAKVGRMTANLAGASEQNRQSIYQQQQQEIWRYINRRENALKERDRWFKDMGNKELGEHLSREYQAFGTADRGEIQAQIDAAKKVLREYQANAKQILTPVKANIDTKGAEQNVESLKVKLIELEAQRKKAIASGDTDLSKNLAKQINQVKSDINGLNPTALSTTHKATKQETASNKVTEAERTYAETLIKNSIRLETGLDTTLDYKKKELAAQERMFDAYNDAYATYKDPAYKKAAADAAEKIKALAGEVKAETDAQEAAKKSARELEAAQRKLADAQQKLAEAQSTGSATAIYQAQKNVDKQQAVVNRLQNPTLPTTQQLTGFEAMKQTVQAEIKFDQMKVDETTLHTLLQTALKNGLDSVTVDYSGLQERIANGIDIPENTWIELQNEINAKLKELGIEPIKIDFKTGGLEEAGKDAKSATKDFQQAASAIGSVGSALSSIEDPSAKVAGIVAQAIATVASAFAGALGTDQTTKSNIWAFIAAAAASTATMISTIASIHSATGYAQGGQIKGNSYSGDNILGMVDGGGIVGLNAGEIVLNQAQTANVANALEGSGMRDIHLSASVSGEQILLVADRTTRRQGRGELATFK